MRTCALIICALFLGVPRGRAAPFTGPLTVIGTGVESNSRSWAILKIGDRHDEVFFEGATVSGIGVLKAVAAKCVLITRFDGSVERRCLGSNAISNTGTLSSASSAAEPPFSPPPDTRQLFRLMTIEREWVGAEGRAVTTFNSMGQPAGILLETLGSNSFLKSLGLQPGDLVVAVNNSPVLSPSDLLKNAIDLQGAMLEVDYLRDGRRHGQSIRVANSVIETFVNTAEE